MARFSQLAEIISLEKDFPYFNAAGQCCLRLRHGTRPEPLCARP